MSKKEIDLTLRSQELIEKLAKKGANPEDVLAAIMMGENDDDNPVIYAILEIDKRRRGGIPTAKMWEGLVNLAKKYEAEMNAPVPLGLRGAMAKELMPYIYPKLSSTNMDAKVDANVKVADMRITFDLGGEVPIYPEPTEDTDDGVTVQ